MNVHRMRFISTICLFLFLILIPACSTWVSNLKIDPTFTSDNIRHGGFSILGCTSTTKAYWSDIDLSDRLSSSLRAALHEKQPELVIVPWREVRKSLDEEIWKQYMNKIREHELLEAEDLDDLAGALADRSRYVVIHRIDSEKLKFESSENHDAEGKIIGYKLSTRYIIDTTFFVFDLEERRRVMYVTIEGSKWSHRNASISERNSIGGLLGSVIAVAATIGDILGDEKMKDIEKFPPPSNQESVMEIIYSEFSKQLPRKE